jgi:ABC-type branched-subunit amino acid transport system substrate-binding protein
MKRSLAVLVCAVALVASACGAKGDDTGAAQGASSTTAADSGSSGTSSAKFGDLDSPCGSGDAKVKAGEGPSTPGQIAVGVANDRTSTIRPGLNKELWDASNAFIKWCNDQGGISGLKIQPVDLDGQLLQVQAAMTKACTSVFAMVGGAFVQDDQEFSGQDGSDFHKCQLIDIPAFAVSVKKSESNGQVQPIPNPAYKKSTGWIQDFKKLYPEESKKNVVVYGELPSLKVVKEQYDAAVKSVGGIEQLEPISYPVAGLTDWGPTADRVISSGATSLYYVGEPSNLANLMAALNQKNWKGKVLNETNIYDDQVFAKGNDAVEGILVRLPYPPFEEASDNPAVQQYLDNLKAYDPSAKAAGLGIQSTSAWLLFASSVKKCAEDNGGTVDRTCVLKTAKTFKGWTAGGLHAPNDPGGKEPTQCSLLIEAKGGKWVRKYPKVGGTDDDQDGYHCPEDSSADVTADLGQGAVDPSRPV